MALRRVRYEEEDDLYRVANGVEIGFARDDALVMSLETAKEVSLAHFANALRRSEEVHGTYISAIFISDVPEEDFDRNSAKRDCWLGYEQGVLAVNAGFALQDPDETPATAALEKLLGPPLSRHNAVFEGVWTDDQGGGTVVVVEAALAGAGRSVGELFALGVDLELLLGAAGGDTQLSAQTAVDLIKAGRLDVLPGQPESTWLDAKREPYKLGTDAEGWELAKDVAAFANTGADALIVLGIETEKSPNGDVLDALRAFRLASMDVVAVRAILRERLTPDVPDIDVGVIASAQSPEYGYGWIFIPAQPLELQPFMVAGALLGTKWHGAHISIPVRSGEDTVHADAAAVHTMLAAGRVALRRAPD
jgi:hypothetical protein